MNKGLKELLPFYQEGNKLTTEILGKHLSTICQNLTKQQRQDLKVAIIHPTKGWIPFQESIKNTKR